MSGATDIPSSFCGESSSYLLDLISRIPGKVTSKNYPYEKLSKVKPYYFLLRVFGCTSFVLCHKDLHCKLSVQLTCGVFFFVMVMEKRVSVLILLH